MIVKYLNLDLLLASSPSGAEARVIASPHGRSPNAVPISSLPSPIPLASASLSELQSLGLSLYASLTADSELRDLLTTNLTAAELEKQGIRLRLQIEPPELRGLPWEALYDDPGGFLALKDVSISRYVAVGAQTGRPLIAQLPLRVLVVSASPAALPPVNFAAERQHYVAVARVQATQLQRLAESGKPLSFGYDLDGVIQFGDLRIVEAVQR